MEENKTLITDSSAILQHKIEVEDDERKFNHDNTYNSCCLRVDKRALNFFTQASFSASIVIFCITMLVSNQDCGTFSRYSPLLTLVIGVWLPSPQFKQ
jgi:hypothetical protein